MTLRHPPFACFQCISLRRKENVLSHFWANHSSISFPSVPMSIPSLLPGWERFKICYSNLNNSSNFSALSAASAQAPPVFYQTLVLSLHPCLRPAEAEPVCQPWMSPSNPQPAPFPPKTSWLFTGIQTHKALHKEQFTHPCLTSASCKHGRAPQNLHIPWVVLVASPDTITPSRRKALEEKPALSSHFMWSPSTEHIWDQTGNDFLFDWRQENQQDWIK